MLALLITLAAVNSVVLTVLLVMALVFAAFFAYQGNFKASIYLIIAIIAVWLLFPLL